VGFLGKTEAQGWPRARNGQAARSVPSQLSRRPLRAPLRVHADCKEMSARPFVLGLTGSIGMGKTTVSGFFQALGVPVLDADATVHTLYAEGGEAVPLVGAAFPGVVQGGAVDRQALSLRVVGPTNEASLRLLESLVHPLVERRRVDFLARAASLGTRLAVLDVPLLYETGLDAQCDAVAVVSAGAEAQRSRVLARPGMSEAKLDSILARQLPDAEKRRRADVLIETGCSLEETRAAVEALVRRLAEHGNLS
jgi:dephospho-CoA kinase